MSNQKFDIVVLGSGPGGYVAAIRSAQLGFKTAIVERAELGGICLNWGCIPTKALLRSAEVFHNMKNASEYGLSANQPGFDLEKVVARSRGIAAQLSGGIKHLMKKNKIDILSGHGKILSGKKVSVTLNDKTQEYSASNIIIATGARSRELPSLPQDGKKVSGCR